MVEWSIETIGVQLFSKKTLKFFEILCLKELTYLNGIYNFQGTTILCEIFENRAKEMTKKFLYNLLKCTSASSLSSCIHRYLSQAEIVGLFKQTLIGGFSCVNTRLSFNSKILLPKNSQYHPKKNLKLIYEIKNETKNIFEDKRVVTKILKMDENNQYGNAMIKPLPTGSIKKIKNIPSTRQFHLNNTGNFGQR